MLPVIVIAVAVSALPHLNGERVCSGGAGEPQDEYRTCIDSERAAEAVLRQKWAQYPAKVRYECANAIGVAPEATYVELQTCVESQTGDAKAIGAMSK